MTAIPQSGAEILLQCLIDHGVEVVFAYPGGATLPLHQALTRVKDRLRVILPRHEQGGGFAASGLARSSGKVGVCFATSGPGATNLVTCLADALRDAVPLLAVTGQVNRSVLGTDAFQEIPIVSVCRSITKHHYLVTRAEDIPRVIREALYLASSGRPGPVLVDVPKDLQARKIVADYTAPPRLPGYQPQPGRPLPEEPPVPNGLDEAFGPEAVIRRLCRFLRERERLDEVFLTTGFGPALDWVARGYHFPNPKQWIVSRGQGAVGFALPAALGVQAAHPGKTVLAVDDAAGLLANLHELASAYCEKLPVKMLVLNEETHAPDFAALARGFRINAIALASDEIRENGWSEWLDWPGPSLLEVRMKKTDRVTTPRRNARLDVPAKP